MIHLNKKQEKKNTGKDQSIPLDPTHHTHTIWHQHILGGSQMSATQLKCVNHTPKSLAVSCDPPPPPSRLSLSPKSNTHRSLNLFE